MRAVGTIYLRKDGSYVFALQSKRAFRAFMLSGLAGKLKAVIRLKGDEKK